MWSRRYNTDGTLGAAGFGGGAGYVTGDWNSGGSDIGTDILIQPDGKILLSSRGPAAVVEGGDGAFSSFNIARYNTDGTLDTSFGGNGFAAFDIGASHDFPRGLALQSDGKILQTGYNNTTAEALVARWNSDGTVDTSFGGGSGYVSIDPGVNVVIIDIHIQDDGRLVLTGYSHNGTDWDLLVMRLDADGTLDTSFGSGTRCRAHRPLQRCRSHTTFNRDAGRPDPGRRLYRQRHRQRPCSGALQQRRWVDQC